MNRRKILIIGLMAIVGLLVLYLLLWPVPINPAAWTPPKAPALTGVYQANSQLAAAQRLGKGSCKGPEDVAIDTEGRIYSGMIDGRILRLDPDGGQPEVSTNTGGVPLGLCFDRTGNLVVADCIKGLISVDPNGSVTILSTEQGGIPFGVTDDLDIAADGTIYFSDASLKFRPEQDLLELMEHRGNGRLLAYDPNTKVTRLVMKYLYYANGVAVSPDQSFVLVAETGKYRVQRYWLAGPRQGQSEIFIDNLPGFPDGITSNRKDTFWLAIVSPRSPSLDALLPRPFMRKIVMRLPKFMTPEEINYGFILGLDADGHVVHNLQGPPGTYTQITNVVEHNGMLYLGSLVEDAIGRLPVPQLP